MSEENGKNEPETLRRFIVIELDEENAAAVLAHNYLMAELKAFLDMHCGGMTYAHPPVGAVLEFNQHANSMPKFEDKDQAWDMMNKAMTLFAASAAYLKFPFNIVGGTVKNKDVQVL
jgi:hypothetical protein